MIAKYYTNPTKFALDAGVSEVPIVVIDITGHCNLKCIHCWNSGHIKKELSKETIMSIISNAPSNARIHFLGGEPLLHPFIDDLIVYSIGTGHYTSLVTNGTMLTPKRIKSLIDTKISEIAISLDGPDAITHDFVRGMGTFEEVWQGIKSLTECICIDNANTVITIAVTAMKQNTCKLPSIVHLLGESDMFIDHLIIDRVVPEGRALEKNENNASITIIPDEWLDAVNAVCRLWKDYPKIQSLTIKGPPLVHEYLTSNNTIFLEDSIVACPALQVRGGARICADGKVFSCSREGLINRAIERGCLSSQGKTFLDILKQNNDPFFNKEFNETLTPLLLSPDDDICQNCKWKTNCIECPIVKLIGSTEPLSEFAHGSNKICEVINKRGYKFMEFESYEEVIDNNNIHIALDDLFQLRPHIYYKQRRNGSIAFTSVILNKIIEFPSIFSSEYFFKYNDRQYIWSEVLKDYVRDTSNAAEMGEYVAIKLKFEGFLEIIK